MLQVTIKQPRNSFFANILVLINELLEVILKLRIIRFLHKSFHLLIVCLFDLLFKQPYLIQDLHQYFGVLRYIIPLNLVL